MEGLPYSEKKRFTLEATDEPIKIQLKRDIERERESIWKREVIKNLMSKPLSLRHVNPDTIQKYLGPEEQKNIQIEKNQDIQLLKKILLKKF